MKIRGDSLQSDKQPSEPISAFTHNPTTYPHLEQPSMHINAHRHAQTHPPTQPANDRPYLQVIRARSNSAPPAAIAHPLTLRAARATAQRKKDHHGVITAPLRRHTPGESVLQLTPRSILVPLASRGRAQDENAFDEPPNACRIAQIKIVSSQTGKQNAKHSGGNL